MPSNFSLYRLIVVHTLCSKLNEVFYSVMKCEKMIDHNEVNEV